MSLFFGNVRTQKCFPMYYHTFLKNSADPKVFLQVVSNFLLFIWEKTPPSHIPIVSLCQKSVHFDHFFDQISTFLTFFATMYVSWKHLAAHTHRKLVSKKCRFWPLFQQNLDFEKIVRRQKDLRFVYGFPFTTFFTRQIAIEISLRTHFGPLPLKERHL